MKKKAYFGATIINGDQSKPVIPNGMILVDAEGVLEYVGERKGI